MDLQKQDSLYIKGFMSEKKSHEVNVMASLCDGPAKKNNIQMVFLCLLFYEFSKKTNNFHAHLQELVPTPVFQIVIECNLMQCMGIIGFFWP